MHGNPMLVAIHLFVVKKNDDARVLKSLLHLIHFIGLVGFKRLTGFSCSINQFSVNNLRLRIKATKSFDFSFCFWLDNKGGFKLC